MIAALVPAAGSSARMGRPKLLFEFGGQSLIGRVVRALRAGRSRARRRGRAAGRCGRRTGRRHRMPDCAGAEVVVPRSRPAEMRDSIEFGLERLARHGAPQSVLLTPGDYPGITAGDCRPTCGIRGQNAGPHRHTQPQRSPRPSDRLAVENRGPDPTPSRWSGRQRTGGPAWGIRRRDGSLEPRDHRGSRHAGRPSLLGATPILGSPISREFRISKSRFQVPDQGIRRRKSRNLFSSARSTVRPREGSGGEFRARNRARPRIEGRRLAGRARVSAFRRWDRCCRVP